MSLRPSGCSRPPSLSLRALRSKARQSRGTHSEHREAFGEIAGACMRFPRRFAPRNDTGGRHSQVRRCAPPNGKGTQVCHCEPCGARRGNLAGCSRNAERPPANSLLPSRDCRVGLRPPRNDTGGRRTQVCPCVPPEAAGSQTCHCEAPQEPRRRPSRRERPGAIAISAPFPPFPIFSALFAGC